MLCLHGSRSRLLKDRATKQALGVWILPFASATSFDITKNNHSSVTHSTSFSLALRNPVMLISIQDSGQNSIFLTSPSLFFFSSASTWSISLYFTRSSKYISIISATYSVTPELTWLTSLVPTTHISNF